MWGAALFSSSAKPVSISVRISLCCAALFRHSSVQFSSVAQSCPTLCDPMNRSTPGHPVHHQLPESTQNHESIESVVPSNHLILCHPLLLLPSIFPSIRVFSNESALHIRWPKYWSFTFSINPSNEHPGLISFRMDWLDLLAVQGTPKSLLQHHSSKASILQSSAFFIVQLSHLHMTTGKTIALTRRTFVGKVMPLLFSMLSRLVITFLPRKNMSSKTFLVCCCCCLVSLIWPFCNPMDCSPPGSTRFPWDFPGKNTGVGCPFLLLGIFPTQRLNLCLLFVRQVFYHWATWEAPLLVYPHCFLLRPVQPRNSPGGTQFPVIKIEQEPLQ